METYSNPISFLTTPPILSVEFRKCVSGEEMNNFACIPCTAGYYLYDPPENNTNCLVCEENAVCLGKNIAFPVASYWRENATSDDFI